MSGLAHDTREKTLKFRIDQTEILDDICKRSPLRRHIHSLQFTDGMTDTMKGALSIQHAAQLIPAGHRIILSLGEIKNPLVLSIQLLVGTLQRIHHIIDELFS